MDQSDRTIPSAPGPLATTVFFIVSALLLPVSLIGYGIYVVYLLTAGRTPGVSTSAQGPLSARWFQHYMGVRQDEAAYRLLMAMPGFSRPGWYLVAGPTLLAHRLTGYVPKAFRYPYEGEIPPLYQAAARQTFHDAAVERYLRTFPQFVILGAGFDTRAYRLGRERSARVRSFEVDAPKTQAVKRELLQKIGIASAGVTFVAADFEQEDWLAKLISAGFDPGQPALFLLEGVILYLDREALTDTFRKIASTSGVVTFDYFTTEPLESNSLYWRYGRAALKAAGEPMQFGVDSTPPVRERLAELLESCGLTLIEQRTLGQETAGKRAWGGFAIAGAKRGI